MLPGSTGQLIFGFFRRISLHLYFRRKTLGVRFTQGFLFRRRSGDLFPDAVDVVEPNDVLVHFFALQNVFAIQVSAFRFG